MDDTEDPDFIQAKMYDEMINWEGRLSRELPVIIDYFDDLEPVVGDRLQILDVACSSGRHSFGLNKAGHRTVGFDISPHFIELATQIAEELTEETEEVDFAELSHFIEADGADDELIDKVKAHLTTVRAEITGNSVENTEDLPAGSGYVDAAILLGNAIANLGNFENGRTLLRNIFTLLRPGGKLFVQTVNKPHKPWYNPLRQKDDVIIQRIMVPEPDMSESEHNMVLHVNQIDAENLEYHKQKADNLFFMYRLDEFRRLAERTGFEVEAVVSGYEENDVEDVDGETLIWKLSKPEILLLPEGLELFRQYSEIGEQEVKERVLRHWQDSIRQNWYHCIRGYRFLYPRISAHPRYAEIIQEKSSTAILDIACHTGTDLRQLYVDGAEKLYGVDISDVFIEFGYELFGDRDHCPIEFSTEDVLDGEFLNSGDLENNWEQQLESLDSDNLDISGSFAKYSNYFGVVHAGSLIHLLDEDDIISLLKRVYLLLEEDGVFFGRTVGSHSAGMSSTGLKFLHSTDSLQSLFNRVGYKEVDVFAMPRKGPIGESSTSTTLQIGFYVKK